MVALWTGLTLGFVVGAQVGPIWLLCVRSVLRTRLSVGLAIGAGAAVVDCLYAMLGLIGVSPLLRVDALRVGLGLVGAAVVVGLGARTLWSAWRVRQGLELDGEVVDPRRAFVTSLTATLSNPLTIAYWASIFAATNTGTGSASSGLGAAGLFVAGIAIGTFSWFTILSSAVSLLRARIGPRLMRTVDVLAGIGLIGFGGRLGWRGLTADR